MSEKEATRAHRRDDVVQTASIYNSDTWGLRLGDLRKLVAAADGMPDDAEVAIDRDGMRNHYSLLDTVLAKRISVTARALREQP